MTNMTEIITVHHGTGRSLATMTTITETEIPGTITTGRGTGTTKTGTGGRTGTGTTGTGSQIGTTGHPETTMRGTGTMTGDMTDTLLHITTPVAAGDHLLLDLHHLGDQTIKESTKWQLCFSFYIRIFSSLYHILNMIVLGAVFSSWNFSMLNM